MNIRELKNQIKNLNNAHFGSFGECVFAYYVVEVLNGELTNLHRDGYDLPLLDVYGSLIVPYI